MYFQDKSAQGHCSLLKERNMKIARKDWTKQDQNNMANIKSYLIISSIWGTLQQDVTSQGFGWSCSYSLVGCSLHGYSLKLVFHSACSFFWQAFYISGLQLSEGSIADLISFSQLHKSPCRGCWQGFQP